MKTQNRAVIVLTALLVALPGLAVAQSALAANAGEDKTVNVGETLTFYGTGSTGDIGSYSWDFGDGTTGSGPTVTKTYSASGTYTVTLVVISANGADTATDTATVTVRTTDSVAPTITHTNTTSGTANSAITITATVTDNVAVQTVTLYYKQATASAYNSTTMSKSGSTYTGTIPSSITTTDIHYYIRAEDSRSTPNVATWPTNAPTNRVTISLTDASAPTITHTASTGVTAGQTLTLSATVTDNVAVSTVKVFYRLATSGSWSNTTMTASGGSYTASISVPSTGVTTLQYYIQATDAAANTARSPSTAPSTPNSVGVSSASAPTITHTAPTSATAGQGVSVSATVSAASGRAIQAVTLHYRARGNSTWETLSMTNFSAANTYSGTIPAGAVTDRGVEYAINATDHRGDSAYSPAAGLTSPHLLRTPPGTPAAPTVTRTASGVTVTWTAMTSTALSSVANYKVYRSTSADSGFGTALTTTSATTYADSAATPGVRYYYKISAVDSYSSEGSKSSATGAALGLAPAAPLVTLAASASGTLTASWAAVTGAGWYIVEKSSDGSSWTQVANTTGTTASLAALTPGESTFARVTPYNPYNEVGSASASASGIAINAAGTPTGLTATRTAGGVTLSWTALSASLGTPLTGYAVERSTSADSGFATIASPTTAAYEDATAASGTVYYYRVSGTNDLGAGTASSAVASTRGVIPGQPTLAVSAGDAQVVASWGTVEGASRYLLERSADGGATWTTAANTTGATATVTGLTNGAAAHFRLTALNAYHEAGAASATKSATPVAAVVDTGGSGGTPTVTPTLVVATPEPGAAVGGSAVTISGTAANAARVTVSIDGATPATATGTTAWTYTWNLGSLGDGPHTIAVRAISSSGHVKLQEMVVTLERSAPTIEPLSPVGDGFTAGAIPVRVKVTDLSAVTVALTLDGAALAATGADGLFTATARVGAGEHTLKLVATDAAGNRAEREWTFTAAAAPDLIPPTVRVSSGPGNGLRTGGEPVVTFAYSDAGGIDASSIRVLVNGNDATNRATIGDGTVSIAIPEAGLVSVTLLVKDAAGHEAKATRTFTVDRDGPSITIAAPAGGILAPGGAIAAKWTDASGVAITTTRVLLDGTPMAKGYRLSLAGVTVTPTGLKAGQHTLRIEVQDVHGNAKSAEATFTVAAAPATPGSEPGTTPDGETPATPSPTPKAPKKGIPGFEAAFVALAAIGAALLAGRRRW